MHQKIMDLPLFIVLCSILFSCSCAEIYYIFQDVTTNKTCSATNGTFLSPCYSIQQLCNDKSELLINKSSVVLLLSPGIHTIPENDTLVLSDVNEVKIFPWNIQEAQVIECQTRKAILLHNVKELNIFSVNFTSCTVRLNSTGLPFKGNVVISDCIFTGSDDYAIAVIKTSFTRKSFNISLTSSKFLSNKGILSSNYGNWHYTNYNTVIILIANSLFLNNWRSDHQGNLHIENANLKLHECSFANNKNGVFVVSKSSMLITNCSFLDNHGYQGGAINQQNSDVKIYGCLFINNSADSSGGAIALPTNINQLTIGDSTFLENVANENGGALHVPAVNIYNSRFEYNFATRSGGAISYFTGLTNKNSQIINTTFSFNQAEMNGGAIYSEENKLKEDNNVDILICNCNFEKNSAKNGGFLNLHYGFLSLSGQSNSIINNIAAHGGAIFANNSIVSFEKMLKVYFENNTGFASGGAIFLAKSHVNIPIEGQVIFKQNRVLSLDGKGGAICVLDDICESQLTTGHKCWIDSTSIQSKKCMYFLNNSAAYGPVLYGGLLDRCYHENVHKNDTLGIDYFKEVSHYVRAPSAITSGPVKICICSKSFVTDCTKREILVEKMRGETMKVIATSVDQDENPVTSVIRANYEETTADLGNGEGRNRVASCTTLVYHIFTADLSATLTLQPEGVCERSPLSSLTIKILLASCSNGFQQIGDRCQCDQRLARYLNVTNCTIDNQDTERKGRIWLSYDKAFLKMTRNCPLDYCNFTSGTISFISLDEQCANHHSGVLCGACQHNYSVALGGSKCLPCSDKYAFIWLTLAFAVAGVLLVALLLVCNMTISAGTLNGLIFYANVISISGLTSLLNCSIHPILSVFIAWLNLDLGIETCFYPGMDTYQKTWLQFVFPLYIILLVIAIIISSYYSRTAMKVFGRNNIALLATLFLLSYSKALKTIITALSTTQVLVSSADNVSAPVLSYRVWTYDGNLEYLEGKHVVLFTVALLFLLFLFLPYTLLLLFGQCVHTLPLRRRWIFKLARNAALVSVLNAYHIPYTRRHRYWTGLMLLVRCVLFLAFSINGKNDRNILLANMYTITVVILVLLLVKSYCMKVYKYFYHEMLEVWFLLNLGVTTLTLCYLIKGNKSYYSTAACNSVSSSFSVALISFLSIFIFHAYLRIREKFSFLSWRKTVANDMDNESNLGTSPNWQIQVPTTSVVDYNCLENH